MDTPSINSLKNRPDNHWEDTDVVALLNKSIIVQVQVQVGMPVNQPFASPVVTYDGTWGEAGHEWITHTHLLETKKETKNQTASDEMKHNYLNRFQTIIFASYAVMYNSCLRIKSFLFLTNNSQSSSWSTAWMVIVTSVGNGPVHLRMGSDCLVVNTTGECPPAQVHALLVPS